MPEEYAARFEDVERILVIKLKHIGDVLLAGPTLDALKHTFPRASLHCLVNQDTAAMVEAHPAVDNVIPFRRKQGLFYELSMLRFLRQGRFDLAVDLCGGGDRGALWSYLSGARYRIGTLPLGRQGFFGKGRLYTHLAATPDHRRHAVMRDLDLVRAFGIRAPEIRLRFNVPQASRERVKTLLAGQGIDDDAAYAVIHPTSRWLFKCGDDEAMAAVIAGMEAELGLKPVLTCGPAEAERERLARILDCCGRKPAVLSGNLELRELGAAIEGARLYVGVDSAPSHLAAAVGTPAIVLFGPTGAYNWGPWTDALGDNPYPAEKGIQRAGVHVVLQQDWACVPCGDKGCRGTRISDCLMQISARQILDEAAALLRASAHA